MITGPCWRFYDAKSGVILPQRMILPDQAHVEMNTPPGCAAVYAEVDHLSQRYDLTQTPPVVVDYQPPAPPDTEMVAHAWDATSKRWVGRPTKAAHAAAARSQRDTKLAACDWVVLRAHERGEPVPPAWATYRQALRDLPTRPGFPEAVEWPSAPA